MGRFYADEDFPLAVVRLLRQRGHDVLTTQDANRASQRIPDIEQLVFAHADGRAILTLNRRHFIKLHEEHVEHSGIVTCTVDPDTSALAGRIHEAISGAGRLGGKVIRVTRPSRANPRTDQDRNAK